MNCTKKAPRIVDPELLKKLDPTERLIAKRFIMEGRWKVKEEIETR